MVAIIGGGSALGLSSTSAATLGRNGLSGDATVGRAGERVYVNSATGNLAIQRMDESLQSKGLDLALLRTYNSQGLLNDDNGDNWRMSVQQKLTFSLFGDTVTKTYGDGADVVFNFDLLAGKYIARDGGGSYDTLSQNALTGQWTFTDGDTRGTEIYNAAGQMISASDTDGNTVTYGYTGALLTSVRDASGQTTYFDYTGNNLTKLRVVVGAQTQSLVSYGYDTSNRLNKVTVDLTPDVTTDAKTYVTTYTYDGTSKRVASITQPDSSVVSFTYQLLLNGQYAVRTVSETVSGTTRTTTFNFGGLDLLAGRYTQCDVVDALNLTTTYLHDGAGQLTSIQNPATGLRTDFSYDPLDGDVCSITKDPLGLNQFQAMEYDGAGNLLTSYDSLGNTVTRTYSATNQLLNETLYAMPDPDGGGLLGILFGPGSPMTTRNVYDAKEHLVFQVSSDGRVTEHRYDAAGQRVATLHYTGATYSLTGLTPADTLSIAQMNAWLVGKDLTQLERVDYTYDARGLLSTMKAWSATTSAGVGSGTASTTTFVYDQRGKLLQKIDPLGFTTDYTYDGLGRVLSTAETITAGVKRTSLMSYDDVGNTTKSTLANGLISTSLYNASGELVSVTNVGPAAVPLGITAYKYDADGRLRLTVDPTGAREFKFYDAASRLIGQVDGDGSLTEFIYDKASQLIKTVRYAVRLDAATQASLVDGAGNPTNVSMATLKANAGGNPGADRVTRMSYNRAGQQVYAIDESGAVTQTLFDGAGRVTDVVQFANRISIARAVDEVLPASVIVLSSLDDRRTRYFYDNDGHRTGVLDAAGFLSESKYNAAGHLIQTIGYATSTPVLARLTGDLNALRPAADNETTVTPERDANTYFFYDGQGRQTGQLDAEGYLTETVYDAAGQVLQTKRYDKVLTYTAGATVASLRPSGVTTHTTSYVYDGLGRVTQETNFEGTVTTKTYDAADKLISQTRALGTSDARTTQTRYDALGRVLQELTAEGSSKIIAGMTPAQIDAIWTQYAVTYSYDLAGRRISATDQAGNKTLYYYDNDSRLRFTVNAAGEVMESRYNALGQLTDELSYYNKLASTTGLTGGLLTAALTTQLTPAADAAHDARTTYTYTLTGQVATRTTAEGTSRTSTYNAFGQELVRQEKVDATRTRSNSYTYDVRGLLTRTQFDTTGLNIAEQRSYDAFGRLSSFTDAKNNVSKTTYDRLGRVVTTTDALNGKQTTTYDAFARTMTQTDALGYVTTYQYNDTSRTVLVNTPENIGILTAHNAHGQTVGVMTQTNANTYTYDLNGRLVSSTDVLGSIEQHSYDAAGRETTVTDARGAVTKLEYDAANRLFKRTVDNGGLALVTTYAYDGQGRVLTVTEPSGRVTKTEYDRDGRVKEVAIDPSGLNIRTGYTYDAESRTLTVTEGVGSSTPRVTEYRYDTLGRRTTEIVNPGGLALTTSYRYDADGNVTRRIDANGNSTWFVYDANNRQTWSVDGAGDAVQTSYDAEGRVTSTRGYVQRVTTTGFGDIITSVTVATDAKDRVERTVYDKDGRAAYSIDAVGIVTERSFDGAGRVTRSRTYNKAIANTAYATPAAVKTALTAAGNDTANIASTDRVNWTAYDQRGHARFTVSGVGVVVEMQYDGNGNITAKTVYDAPLPAGSATDTGNLANWVSTHTNIGLDQTTRYWYDNANRLRFTLDGEGYLSERRYNDAGRIVSEIVYASRPNTIAAGATLAAVVSAVVTSANDQTVALLSDKAGRVIQRTDGEGYVTKYVYDASGNRTETWQALDNPATLWATSRSYFDAANREAYSLSAEGYLTAYTRDGLGNVLTKSLYKKKTTVPAAGAMPTPVLGDTALVNTYQYDAASRVLQETDAMSVSTQYQYDGQGNRKLMIEAAGTADARQTSYTYDAAGRLVETTRAVGTAQAITTHFDLDSFGNVAVRRDGYGTAGERLTGYGYDQANRLIRESYIAQGIGTVTDKVLDASGNVKQITLSGIGDTSRVESFLYNRRSQQVAHTDGAGGYTKYTYDAAGNRASETNPVALALTQKDDQYYRDLRKRLGIVDGGGNGKLVANLTGTDILAIYNRYTTVYTYDRRNLLAQTTEPQMLNGVTNITKYTYDGAGNKRSTVQAFGLTGQQRTSAYTYDKDKRLLTVTDPMGGVTTYEYDVLGNQTRITDAKLGVRDNTYDAVGRLLTAIQTVAGYPGGGLRTDNVYDRRGNVTKTTQAYSDGSDARVNSYTYDILDRQLVVTDAEGFATSFTYDLFGNQTGITHGQYLLTSGQAGYDATKAARAKPLTTTYVYDGASRMTSMTDGQGNVTQYGYNIGNDRTSVTEAANGGTAAPRSTLYYYDDAHHLTRVATPGGGLTLYTYDAAGNKILERQLQSGTEYSNPVWVTKGFEYDAMNRLTVETDSYGVRTVYFYDAVGNNVEIRSAEGTSDERSVGMAYDLNNRKTADYDGYAKATRYEYDKLGNRTKVTDALGNVSRYYYDGAGKLVSVLDPVKKVSGANVQYINTFKYDSAGNRTEERVYMTPFTGTPSDTVAPTPTANATTDLIVTLAYDKLNQLTSRTEADGTRTDNTYDSAGKKITEKLYANTAAPRTRSYVYDNAGRMTKFTDVDGTVADFTYDSANNRLSETLTNNADPNPVRQTVYTYDLNNRRITETFDPGALNIVHTTAYDAAGNVVKTTVNTTVDVIDSAYEVGEIFTYDLDNRQIDHGIGNVSQWGTGALEPVTGDFIFVNPTVRNTTTFGYDKVGNRTSVKDPNGNITNYVFDKNSRQTQEIRPSVQVYNAQTNSLTTARPTITSVYDDVGNLVQVTDPNGNKTISYYDGNHRMVARITGDLVLTDYTYDAAGRLVTQVMDMDRLTVADQNPAVRPAGKGITTRRTDYQYDKAGRLTLTSLPAINVTTLGGTNTNSPTVSVAPNVILKERHVFDAYGNEVETYDRANNRTVSYYDVNGRKTATIDAMGYMVSWDYDSQGNVTAQRIYANKLATQPSSPPPATPPTPPAGTVHLTNRYYDKASRLVREVGPYIDVYDPATGQVTQQRVTTVYTYDNSGHQLSRTVGWGTALATTEGYFYDAAGRRIMVMDSARVLNFLVYDHNGNVTAKLRYYGQVPTTLPNLNLALDPASTDPNARAYILFVAWMMSGSIPDANGNPSFQYSLPDQAQRQTFVYDAINRLITEKDEGNFFTSTGAAVPGDDIAKTYRYDGNDNRTWRQDEDGFVTKMTYDGANRVLKSVTADGNGTNFRYDAAGNPDQIFTGELASNQSTAATAVGATQNVTVVGATVSTNVNITWTTAAGTQQSWVVWDTVSPADVTQYAKSTSPRLAAAGVQSSATIPSPAAGQTVYFRVVTQDAAGNKSWTAEQSITSPPRFSSVVVSQSPTGQVSVRVRFDAGATGTTLSYGPASGALSSSVGFALQGDGSYLATLPAGTNTNTLAYMVNWKDAGNVSYSSAKVPFSTPTERTHISGAVIPPHPVVVNGVTKYWFNYIVAVPNAMAAGFTQVQAQWRPVGSSMGYSVTAVPGVVTAGSAYASYTLQPGGDNPMAAGNYEMILTGVRRDGSTVVLDAYTLAINASSGYVMHLAPSWQLPQVGTSQVVIAGGVLRNSTRSGGRVISDIYGSTGTVDYMVAYTQPVSTTHSTVVTSSATTGATNLNVQTTLATAEVNNMGAGGLRVSWRPAGTGINFANDVAMPVTGTAGVYKTNTTTLNGLAAGQYDFKVYYLDKNGNEVIVDWLRASSAQATQTFTGTSQTVLARETGGNFVQDTATGSWSIVPGTYTGPADLGWLAAPMTLSAKATGKPAESRNTNGLSTGYYSTKGYDALNNRIASNDGDGLLRAFGVDANGNVVETRNYGTSTTLSGAHIDTYSAYDARGRKVAEFMPSMTPSGTFTAQRPVERYDYDALDNMTSRTDALGKVSTFKYDALGHLLEETTAGNPTAYHRRDLLGREIATVMTITTPTGPLTRTERKSYDLQGHVTREIDGGGKAVAYSYDLFGRLIAKTDGRGVNPDLSINSQGFYTTNYRYDGHNRLQTVREAQGWHLAFSHDKIYQDERTKLGYAADETTLSAAQKNYLIGLYTVTYGYDKRGNRTSASKPANSVSQGMTQLARYDSMGRVQQELSTEGAGKITAGMTQAQIDAIWVQYGTSRSYDAYGNLIGETDAMGRTKSSVFGGFARVSDEIDEDGNVVHTTYDRWGRVQTETDPNNAATGKSISKTYDDAGRVLTITDARTGVNTTYTYDLAGRRITEVINTPVDSKGKTHNRNITYYYDDAGRMTGWSDSVNFISETITYDGFGNRTFVSTSAGDRNSYTFNLSGELLSSQLHHLNGSGLATDSTNTYQYDAAHNRIQWTFSMPDGTNEAWSYVGTDGKTGVDASNRVVRMTTPSKVQLWSYDNLGNVLNYSASTAGVLTSTTVNTYNAASVATTVVSKTYKADGSVDTDSTTTTVYDKTQRAVSMQLKQGGKTFDYTYNTAGDGRELGITATGGARGTSTSTYDVNNIRATVNRGMDDQSDRADTAFFVADNEGHIIYQWHDDGKAARAETREYFYANGAAVGEAVTYSDNTKDQILDSGDYSLVKNNGSEFPGSSVSSYTVRAGDTLQSIANQLYGNPSLWFVIADANGLNPSAPLKEGTSIQVPNTIQAGSITADNHVVYSEGNVVGSTLPNLKSPPPKKKNKCVAIVAIVVTVIIAVVVSVVTIGIAAPAAAAATAGVASVVLATTITVGVFAAVGVAVAVAGSFIRQGILIAMGAQEKFSWEDLAVDAAVGAISGAASGLSAGVQVAAKAGQLSLAGSMTAKVAGAALEAAKVATPQLIKNGKITSWTSLAAAAIGGYASVGGAIGEGFSQGGAAASAVGQASIKSAQLLGTVATISRYVSPWVQVAETYVRNDGHVSALDWISAAGSTLSEAINSNANFGSDTLTNSLKSAGARMASNVLVSGAMAAVDEDAAKEYLMQSVGQEIGQVAGEYIGATLKRGLFDKLQQKADKYVEEVQARKKAEADAGGAAGARGGAVTRDADAGRGANPEPVVGYDEESGTLTADGFRMSLRTPDEPELTLDSDLTSVSEASGSQEKTVTVKRGQTLTGITGVNDPETLDKIAQYNGLASRHEIRAGQNIVIPDAETLAGIDVSDALHERGAAGDAYFAKRRADMRAKAAEREAAAIAASQAPVEVAQSIPYNIEGDFTASNASTPVVESSERGAWDSFVDAASDYVDRSVDQLVLGNYTENVTLLGTAMQVGTGFLGVDLPADIRDLTYDVTHWEWTWGHAGQTALDAVGVLPGIGVLKNADEVGVVLKNGVETGSDLMRQGLEQGANIIESGRRASSEFVAGIVGETRATRRGKEIHAELAAERRLDSEFDMVNEPFRNEAGDVIQVPRRVDLETGEAKKLYGTQSARPDAVVTNKGTIIDDKPVGRPIAKDRQEMIRFIDGYQQANGTLPKRIAIQRYDPKTGAPTVTELYSPSDFLPQ